MAAGAIDQARRHFLIDIDDDAILLKFAQTLLESGDTAVGGRPLRDIAKHGRAVAEHDALDLRLQRHLDIGRAFIDKPLPACRGHRRDLMQALRHFRIDFPDHRLQQSLFVAEMVVERTARQARFCGEIIHRGLRIADGAKGLARCRHELGARFCDHFRARLLDHKNSCLHTRRIYFYIRRVF